MFRPACADECAQSLGLDDDSYFFPIFQSDAVTKQNVSTKLIALA